MQEPIIKPKTFAEITTTLEGLREDINHHLKDTYANVNLNHISDVAKIYALYYEGVKLISNLQRDMIRKMLKDGNSYSRSLKNSHNPPGEERSYHGAAIRCWQYWLQWIASLPSLRIAMTGVAGYRGVLSFVPEPE